jgi:Tol biopolymer transport system component
MTMRSDGTGTRKLLGGNWEYFAPEYSPDGEQIAFEGTRGGLASAIWVIGTDGTGLQRLTGPRLMAFWASWSPDGEHILFSDRCCRPHSNVWVMNADGTEKQQLTNVPPDQNAAFATYAPNGRKIVLAASGADPNTNAISVMRADGSGLHRITSTQPGALLTDWGPRP